MNNMFNKIKKKHSESFAKAIRDYHSAILDIPNLDQIIKYSGSDTAIFPYLYSLTQPESYSTSNEYDYIELFNKASYQIEHTSTVESFKKYKTYFKKGELLCSFNNIQNRLNNFICLWAVKHNVSEIKRSKKPARQDAYGTSVICIQISKTTNFISIKNRYNHSVTNPDNTFNSNPDNIIYGLSSAIEKHFNISFKKDNSIPDGFMVIGDKIIKVIDEYDGIYFGINCYIKNGELIELNTDYEYLFDTYVLSIRDKKIYNLVDVDDCFVDIITELLKSNSVYIENKTIHIGNDSIILNDNNQIIGLCLDSVVSIGNDFLYYNTELRELRLDSVVTIGNYFLYYNKELRELRLDSVENIGDKLLLCNTELRERIDTKLQKVT